MVELQLLQGEHVEWYSYARLFVIVGSKVIIADIPEQEGQVLADELGKKCKIYIARRHKDYEL